jgi:hypothetical protein
MSSIIRAWGGGFSNCKSLKISAGFWFNKISSEFNLIKISNPLLSDIDLQILNAANVVAIASNNHKADIQTFLYYADSAGDAIKALNTLKQYFPQIPVVVFLQYLLCHRASHRPQSAHEKAAPAPLLHG